MTRPKVAISLVTYNSEKYIPYILPAIAKQKFKDWQLFILDNQSSDETVKAIREEAINCKLLEQRYNMGFSRAHNAVINWSDSDYLLVLNADVLLAEDYLAKLVEFLDKHPEVASVSGKLLRWDFDNKELSNIIDSYGLEIDKRYYVKNKLQGASDSQTYQSGQVFGLSGTAALYRRQALEATKIPKINNPDLYEYFDEDFFAYKEDVDLAWRLRLNGWEHYVLADAVAYHDRTISSDNNSFRRRRSRRLINVLSYCNHLAMIKKNSFSSLTWRFFPRLALYESAKWLYLLIIDRSSITGLLKYWRLRPKMVYKRQYIRKLISIKPRDLQSWFR
ncbi:MAG: glycosyltransferase family 2 protein [Candidatus Komeilibacteria bacterium]